jgi:hypothetical protein
MVWSRDDGAGVGQAARLQQEQKENTIMVNPMILRTEFVIAMLMALGGVLSAYGFSNTFNYGHGQGRAKTAVMSSEPSARAARTAAAATGLLAMRQPRGRVRADWGEDVTGLGRDRKTAWEVKPSHDALPSKATPLGSGYGNRMTGFCGSNSAACSWFRRVDASRVGGGEATSQPHPTGGPILGREAPGCNPWRFGAGKMQTLSRETVICLYSG